MVLSVEYVVLVNLGYIVNVWFVDELILEKVKVRIVGRVVLLYFFGVLSWF